ncbi:unnamed protein product, partial [Brassica napus]
LNISSNLSPKAIMDSEIDVDNSPAYRVYKSGRIERLSGETFKPPSPLTPENGVVSKDTLFSPEHNLSVRIFLPEKASAATGEKLPLLVYFHGGGFVIETAFSPTYHTFLTTTVAAAGCLAVSVDYRRAPEFPIPQWINKHADFEKLFLAGDSAGGNICHHLATRAKREGIDSVISGVVLIHPYFWGKAPVDEFETRDERKRKGVEARWRVASPNSEEGVDDPLFNVVGSESVDISGLGCGRVLVVVAGDDTFARQGLGYAAKLEKSGWEGEVEVMEIKDEGHVHHLKSPDTDNARKVVNKVAEFIQK